MTTLAMCMEQINFKRKRVLIRVDLNVPLTEGKITNNQRYVLEKGAKTVVLLSHLGQPEGQVDKALSLRVVVPELEAILGRKVTFLDDCVGSRIQTACSAAEAGSVILLENLRFHAEEEGTARIVNKSKIKIDEASLMAFRSSLSKLGDIFVNDAIAVCNRWHSSVVGINLDIRVSGLLLRKELEYFGNILNNPSRPFLAIFGGVQVFDKIKLMDILMENLDGIILGVDVACTFLKVLNNVEIGDSNFDIDASEMIEELVMKAKNNNVKIHFPQDFVTGNALSPDAKVGIALPTAGIPKGWMGLDVGAKTNLEFSKVIENAKTILWNGPPGHFEFDLFSGGTKAMMDAVVKVTRAGAVSVIAGNQTASCAKKFNTFNKISHVSTGGRAGLDFLHGKSLPGVEALSPARETRKLSTASGPPGPV